jgi:L-alanine-DL-glutamate epimerase-like enolase superfamily enzyme
VPVSQLLGRVHKRIPLYGSGGFTSLTETQLARQLEGWLDVDGVSAVKIKIGEDRGGNVDRDLRRIAFTRKHIGADVDLMVDANGGYQTKQAVRVAEMASAYDIGWFEEPVSSDHLGDLAMLRSMLAADVTAGEYGTTPDYFRTMLAANAVDCLQVDASRCGGYTGLLAAASVADAFGVQVSTHCAPHLHAPACAAIPNLRHAEWFADHVRADATLFDGLATPSRGRLPVQDDRPGHGMTLRTSR